MAPDPRLTLLPTERSSHLSLTALCQWELSVRPGEMISSPHPLVPHCCSPVNRSSMGSGGTASLTTNSNGTGGNGQRLG
jgi:hypothetical protein